MSLSIEQMVEATRLTRSGKLREATSLIQQLLRRGGAPAAEPDAQPVTTPVRARTDGDVIDVPFRELSPSSDSSDSLDSARDDVAPPTSEPASTIDAPAQVSWHTLGAGAHQYRYLMHKPAGDGSPMPVVIMLHGCKQDAEDFARGTAMHEVAAREGAIVVYPEQIRSANSMGCWNWFEPAHQVRGKGEPAMIASLAKTIVSEHGGDPSRMYVAGLSAGGAMAALVAHLYPEVFAAVGVHSGLPAHSANDVVSAFAAMRKGAAADANGAAVPTFVIHGTADKTVHASNGKRIVEASLESLAQRAGPLEATPMPIAEHGKRKATKTSHASADGTVWLEHWEVAAGPHAWSGGDESGSFTDPSGSDASAAMLAFFLRHRLQ